MRYSAPQAGHGTSCLWLPFWPKGVRVTIPGLFYCNTESVLVPPCLSCFGNTGRLMMVSDGQMCLCCLRKFPEYVKHRVLFHDCCSVFLGLFEATPIKSHRHSVAGNTTKVSVAICNFYLIVSLGYISTQLINAFIEQQGKCFIY